jgi:hypothetical protein
MTTAVKGGPDQALQDQQAVLTERRGHVLLVTLNRPAAGNAVNLAVTLGLGDALEEAERDRDIWAVIVTGAGDKAFCAGADLKAISRGESLAPKDPARAAWGFAGYVTHHISKPTIAVVNGFALGGGTEISLASDLVVAADSASFGLPKVKRCRRRGAGTGRPDHRQRTPFRPGEQADRQRHHRRAGGGGSRSLGAVARRGAGPEGNGGRGGRPQGVRGEARAELAGTVSATACQTSPTRPRR